MSLQNSYRDDLAYIHDRGYGDVARDAAGRLVDELARAGHTGGTVVDLGCGSGILARRLSEAGYRVLGTDLSESMVELARARAPGAVFHVGSFLSADLPVCAAVTAIGEVLNYQCDPANNDRERAALLRRVFEALIPGGLFLFDVAGPERADPGRHQAFTEGPDWAVLVENNLDRGAGVLTRNITSFRRVGTLYRRDAEVHRLSLIDPTTLVKSLRAVGFETLPIPCYMALPLPRGTSVFLCRKPLATIAQKGTDPDKAK